MRYHADRLSNEIGHLGYLIAKQAEDLKIKAAIHAAMLQNLISIEDQFYDLWDFEFQVFSQWGEDGILNHIFQRIGIQKPNCVEIGIENFTECNTRFLAHYRNSNLYLVDYSPGARLVIDSLDLKWKSKIEFEQCFVTPRNINEILDRAKKLLGTVDCLSLDVDGMDYWILESINQFAFDVIVLEYNSIFGPNQKVSVPYRENFIRDTEHFSQTIYGASLASFIELLKSKGYVFLGTNRVNTNSFFVKESHSKKFEHLQIRQLVEYTKSNIRESRDEYGKLSFLSLNEVVPEVLDCIVVDTITKEELPLRHILEI
jgi:hypothetical protein